ncbi:Deoxyribodipyrimidine photo-lyase [Olea europaea subsp. europaea]|nr:Deoxyribodipyrimidine photo-lyase [Olea europaea subsp. europaea]
MIISEIARRRVLEYEVRRELMMERELAQRKGEDGFPFGPSSGIGYDSIRFPLVGMRSVVRSLEERVAMPPKEKERMNIRHENAEIETQPFQRCITEPRISEVKSVSDRGKEKEKVVLLAKPHEYLSREKRKAATSSVVDDDELPSAAISRKKAKEEWSCALCQVSATSERALKDHVQGKKHKSKEAALRAQRGGKNYNIGLFPKKAAMPVTVSGTKNLGFEGVKSATQSMHLNKMGEMSSEKNNMPLLQEIQKLDNLKNNQLEVLEIQKDGNSKKKNYKFWCEMCQVGAFSRSVMNAHRKGKKHVKRLHEFDQNGADSSKLKKSVVRVNDSEWVAGDGKNTAMENVGKAVDVVSSEDHKTIDIANSEDHKAKEAAKQEGNEAMSSAEADDKENNDVAEQEYNATMDATKPVNNKDNDTVHTEYTEAMNAARPDDNEANDAVQTEYKMAADAAKPDDYEADDVVKLEFTEAMVAAKPEDNKADDAAEPEFSETANAAKPDHNQLDDEFEA